MKKKIDIRGKAFDLKNFVEYQAAAVVSREILNRKTGTVTVFSFGKGEGLSEHTAPFDALVYIVDGKAKIAIAGKAQLVKKGEFIILPAGKPHALKGEGKFKMLLVMIRS